MDKKLPKVFANKIDKELKNNDRVFYGNKKEIKSSEPKKRDELDVYQKINRIFSSNRYVYKADVVITLENSKVTKKIIGRNKSELITMDNEIINIDDIYDIQFKE